MFFLDLQTLRAEDEGWLVLDVTAASDHGLLNRSKDLGLRLYVETEDGKAGGQAANLLPGSDQRVRVAPQLCSFLTGTLAGYLPSRPCLSPVEGGVRPHSSTRCLGAEPPLSQAVGTESPKVGPDRLCDYIKGPQGWSRGVRESRRERS